MNRNRTYCPFAWLLCFVLLVCAPLIQAQGPLGDVSDLKKEVSDLKAQIQKLTDLVLQMRKTMLETGTAAPVHREDKERAREKEAVKQAPASPGDEEHLTRIICNAVGDFFSEAETALNLTDPDAAREEMQKTLEKLTARLRGYQGTHRVDKLLRIYEGLAWDTYTAVQLRQSIEGNSAFLESLRRHRQKYRETCPHK